MNKLLSKIILLLPVIFLPSAKALRLKDFKKVLGIAGILNQLNTPPQAAAKVDQAVVPENHSEQKLEEIINLILQKPTRFLSPRKASQAKLKAVLTDAFVDCKNKKINGFYQELKNSVDELTLFFNNNLEFFEKALFAKQLARSCAAAHEQLPLNDEDLKVSIEKQSNLSSSEIEFQNKTLNYFHDICKTVADLFSSVDNISFIEKKFVSALGINLEKILVNLENAGMQNSSRTICEIFTKHKDSRTKKARLPFGKFAFDATGDDIKKITEVVFDFISIFTEEVKLEGLEAQTRSIEKVSPKKK